MIDVFGGRGANKRSSDACTGSDGATDDESTLISFSSLLLSQEHHASLEIEMNTILH